VIVLQSEGEKKETILRGEKTGRRSQAATVLGGGSFGRRVWKVVLRVR